MALLMFSIVVMSMGLHGQRQRREGSFMPTNDRLKVTNEKADKHDDMIIMMIITLILMRKILLIFGDMPTLQMIHYCCETDNRKQGRGELGHKSSGRGKILRQYDRIQSDRQQTLQFILCSSQWSLSCADWKEWSEKLLRIWTTPDQLWWHFFCASKLVVKFKWENSKYTNHHKLQKY